MPDLSAFPITKRWPAAHPDRLQLYSLNTPNGVKVSIMLEETGLPYEPHLVDFGKDDQKTPEFLSLNPNGKIPAIIDPDGPGGKPLGLFESGGQTLIGAAGAAAMGWAVPGRRAATAQGLGEATGTIAAAAVAAIAAPLYAFGGPTALFFTTAALTAGALYAGVRLSHEAVPDMPQQNGMPIYNKPDAERAWGKLVALYKSSLV